MALTQVPIELSSTPGIVDNSNATAITIDSSENVGIGRSPRVMLDVAGEAAIAYNATYGLRFYNQEQNNWSSIGNNVATGSSTATLVFKDASGEAFRLDGSGNVLVGKTTADNSTQGVRIYPTGRQSIVSEADTALIVNRRTSDGHIAEFRKDGTNIGRIGVESGDNFIIEATATDHAGLLLWGSGGSGRVTPRLNGSEANGTVDLGRSAGRFKDLYLSGQAIAGDGSVTAPSFRGTDTNTGIYFPSAGVTAISRNGVEGLRLDSSGNLLVGRTSVGATGDGHSIRGDDSAIFSRDSSGESMIVARNSSVGDIIRLYAGGVDKGSINFDGGSTISYTSGSDQRLKENIVDAPSASNDIDALQVRSFDWKSNGAHQKYGMIAQEMQTVAPEAVWAPADPDEMMGVDYSKLVPMLVKEIQSLRARVAQLESN